VQQKASLPCNHNENGIFEKQGARLFSVLQSKTSVPIRDERENGADQIRKPLEGDGIQPQIGEAGCASFFGFAKQNVRPNPGRTRKMMQTK
jgi:hypothetical protein